MRAKEKDVAEIMQGMTVEEMTALFFDKALIEAPYKVYQLNSKGQRYYYRYSDKGEIEFYPSVTTILAQTLPQSPWLSQWIATKGIQEAERYKNERAAYGTFMHAIFEELLINKTYDLDGLKDELASYIEANALPVDFIYYADDLKKDILAFAQFVIDYDVKPIAVEIALVHPEKHYAGMIDCPCSMLEKIGGKKRINAIIDFKSGRKGFYEENELQLHLYKDLWNVNYPNIQIDRVFNFSPKDWRKKPSYNFKDQTDAASAKKIPALLELAGIANDEKDNIFTSCSGIVDVEKHDLTDNVTSLTLAELVKSKATKHDIPMTGNAVEVKPKRAKRAKPAVSGKKKAAKSKTPAKRATAPKAAKKSEISQKKAQSEAKVNLLNNDIDI